MSGEIDTRSNHIGDAVHSQQRIRQESKFEHTGINSLPHGNAQRASAMTNATRS
ncbi:hypothetical protein [Alteromonas sp. ASW11-130]|uniref:hypothetical protein n=1 Tax=Alteromonas sp. ASW11-130 TaxID=3015775 RepID=UPI0022428F6C|nr:hypothetical protein [Alteromonas sp. ASW11-130]MCW8093376.1 hypothetical protein [Alteromonas sp. ASW11-130]